MQLPRTGLLWLLRALAKELVDSKTICEVCSKKAIRCRSSSLLKLLSGDRTLRPGPQLPRPDSKRFAKDNGCFCSDGSKALAASQGLPWIINDRVGKFLRCASLLPTALLDMEALAWVSLAAGT